MFGSDCVLQHAWDISFGIGTGDVGDSGRFFIDFLDDVSSDDELCSNNFVDFWVGMTAGLGGDVVVVSVLFSDTYDHKISVGDWPLSLVLHVDDFEGIFSIFLVQNLHADQQVIDFLGDFWVAEELED